MLSRPLWCFLAPRGANSNVLLSVGLVSEAVSAAVSAAVPVASARVVTHAQGLFQVSLPDTFSVNVSGQRLVARSKAGNARVFARSEPTASVRYDFGGHFARWEQIVRGRGLYSTLRRMGDRRAVRADGQVAVFRTYDAVALRNKTQQPYRVVVLAAHSPRLKRAYTLAIAAHSATFIQYKAQLGAIATSFTPIGATPPKLTAARPVSLRGLLARKASGVVAAKAGTSKKPLVLARRTVVRPKTALAQGARKPSKPSLAKPVIAPKRLAAPLKKGVAASKPVIALVIAKKAVAASKKPVVAPVIAKRALAGKPVAKKAMLIAATSKAGRKAAPAKVAPQKKLAAKPTEKLKMVLAAAANEPVSLLSK